MSKSIYDLTGKVAIVTGARRGIGKEIALTFAEAGATVVVSDVAAESGELEAVAKQVQHIGQRSLAIACDVRVVQQVRDMVKRTIDEFRMIDILVNNAAITGEAVLLEQTEKDWNDVMDTNLKGVFFCIQAVAKYMMEQRYGKILNISSFAGRGGVIPGLIAYSAAKAGVIQLTKSCAQELGPYGVNVNAIAPGTLMNPMTYTKKMPEHVKQFVEGRQKLCVLGRLGTNQDVANLVLFMASNNSSFICGETIAIDGGRTDRM